MCQNTTMRVHGALIKRYCVLCSKECTTLHSCHNFPAGPLQATRGARICETSILYSVIWTYTLIYVNITNNCCIQELINFSDYFQVPEEGFVYRYTAHWQLWQMRLLGIQIVLVRFCKWICCVTDLRQHYQLPNGGPKGSMVWLVIAKSAWKISWCLSKLPMDHIDSSAISCSSSILLRTYVYKYHKSF